MSARNPKYRKHSTRDVGFVEVGGRRQYLPGRYDSPESLAAYHKFLSGRTVGPKARTFLTIAALIDAYLDFAEGYYPLGNHSEYANMQLALKTLPYDEFVDTFGPRRLREIAEQLSAKGNSRSYINGILSRIKRFFKWAASEERIPVEVYQAIATVPGLRKNQATQPPRRRPVAMGAVLPVFCYLAEPVKAMLWLQIYTGARSGSICQAKAEQFDTSADPWLWRPRHKTEYRGTEVVLPIGPRCQTRIAKFLGKPGFMFQPQRQNPRYRDHYDTWTYRQAIVRAQELAGVTHWTPHQLRHARGQSVRRLLGIEAAQAVLGHAKLDATQLYAGSQLALAVEFAVRHG